MLAEEDGLPLTGMTVQPVATRDPVPTCLGWKARRCRSHRVLVIVGCFAHGGCSLCGPVECDSALAGGSTSTPPQRFFDSFRLIAAGPQGPISGWPVQSLSRGADCVAVPRGRRKTWWVERLSDAHRLGHRVLAVVRGTAQP